MENVFLTYGVPAGALVIALLGWIYSRHISSSFKKRYPMTADEYKHRAPGE